VTRHEFLAALHRLLRPRNYFEIGVNDGRSLALAAVPSVGVDPAYKIKVPLHPDAKLVKATSDAFFEREDPLHHLRPAERHRGLRRQVARLSTVRRPGPEPTLDFAFIDGMHWFEFALRDFINVERHASNGGVIVFDDVLPRTIEEAARDRVTKFWAGDVYKIAGVLRDDRPDLVVLAVDTQPTGLLVVLNPDPASTVLRDHYDEIVAANASPDPQPVPRAVLERAEALDAQALLDGDVFGAVVAARDRSATRAELALDLGAALEALRLAAAPRASAPGVGQDSLAEG
jgi:hypothetical protein